MAANTGLGSSQVHACVRMANSNGRLETFSVQHFPKSLSVHSRPYYATKFLSIRASVSRSLEDAVQLPSNRMSGVSRKRSNEAALTLLRHGESMWNEKDLFTGCVDVPLTENGVKEALEAGKRISNIPIEVIYTSSLIRAQMTAVIAMTQHRCKKVPVILHNDNDQDRRWSKIHSEEAKKQSISVITARQLNERMYGDLQGFNKEETADRVGKELVHAWRRTYAASPPNGESLEMCGERAVSFFREHIEPKLSLGTNLLLTAHANSLRSIVMYLDKLTPEEVIRLDILTGIPMLYIFKNGKFIRRGSPIKPTETGVYAYTRNLALYREKLDKMPD